MANPLKLLKLKQMGFQFILETPVDAPPAKVWKALMNVGAWFKFEGQTMLPMSLEPKIGGRFMSDTKAESRLYGMISHLEPNKLLRIYGQMGMTHLPVSGVMIWELAPQAGGKKTLLRFCHRASGMMTADSGKKHQGGWKQLLPQIKKLAEEKGKVTR